MNLRSTLEQEHSKRSTSAIIDYIGNNKGRFAELMDVFLEGEYRLTQRAAWPLSYIAVTQPQLAKPYLKRLVQVLGQTNNHPAVPRNILRLFEEIKVPASLAASLFDHCLRHILSESSPVAVRAYAITVAAGIASEFPDLKGELDPLLLQLSQLDQPAALRMRIRKALGSFRVR
jgi:hypothetical protein